MEEQSIFLKALEKTSDQERAAWLDEICGTGNPLRERIDALLLQHDQAESFLENPVVADLEVTGALAETLDNEKDLDLPANKEIGPYKLLQKIGEGGMGAVWMAEQEKPVRRRVALKLIKSGMADKDIIARFEAERQALAMMDHPNIARVLDAGTTANGNPFFVMELVDGKPLTKYCDQNKLSIPDRLELFIAVCRGVHHAHQKGILHRDLKPSNVLIGMSEGKPVAKVIDFGLAKAVEHAQKLTDKTMFTQIGQIVGTLQYMSPEQADTGAIDVDTRTDIYSLGVILYEMLTGSTPLDQATMGQNALLKVLETLRETEPPRPSDRLSSSGDAITGIGEQRKISPAKLQSILRGELDWVVMKALEKDRTRRYDSASGFADDIQRYLDDEAVHARPPSKAYQLKKFVRKNRGLVAATGAIAGLLVVAATVSTYFAIQADIAKTFAFNQEQKAIQQKENAEKEKTKAEYEAETTKEMLLIMTSSFMSVDPITGATYEMSAKDVLVNVRKMLTRSELDDLAKARMLGSLSVSFLGISENKFAISTANEWLEINTENLGAEHPDTINAMINLALAFCADGRINDGMELHKETLELSKKVNGLKHSTTLRAMNNLAAGYNLAGKLKEALEIWEQIFSLYIKVHGPEHPLTLEMMTNLAVSYHQAGRLNEALELRKKTLELQTKVVGSEHPQTLATLMNIGNSYDALGMKTEALNVREKTLKLHQHVFGEEHRKCLSAMGNLAVSYGEMGRTEEGVKLQKKVLKLKEKNLGANHYDTLRAMTNLSINLSKNGEWKEALELREKTLNLHQQVLGPDHHLTLVAMANLAASYHSSGRMDEAIQMREQCLKLRQEVLGLEHFETVEAMNGLAESYQAVGRLKKSMPLREIVFQSRKTTYGEEHPYSLTAMGQLAVIYSQVGQIEQSLKLAEEALRIRTKTLGDTHSDTLNSLSNLAFCLKRAGKNDEAFKLREKALVLSKQALGLEHQVTILAMEAFVYSLETAGRLDDAVKLAEQTLVLRQKTFAPGHLKTLFLRCRLSAMYSSIGPLKKAIEVGENAVEETEKHLGPNHRYTINAKMTLGSTHSNNFYRPSRALVLFHDSYSTGSKIWEPENSTLQLAKRNLATTLGLCHRKCMELLAENKYQEAHDILRLMAKHHGPHESLVANVPQFLHLSLIGQKEWSKAIAEIDPWLEKEYQKKKPNNFLIAGALGSKAVCLLEQSKFDEAQKFAQQTLEAEGCIWVNRLRANSVIAVCLAQEKEFDQAIEMAANAVSEFESRITFMAPSQKWMALRAIERAIKVYGLAEKQEEVKHLNAKLIVVKANIMASSSKADADKLNNLVWKKVASPSSDSKAPITQKELEKMRQFCQQFPTGTYYNTLAVAEFRTGNYELAIAAAEISLAKLPKELKLPSPLPGDLAIIAMSYHLLDDRTKAEEFRERMKTSMKLEQFKNDKETQSFVDEVGRLFDGGQVSPDDNKRSDKTSDKNLAITT